METFSSWTLGLGVLWTMWNGITSVVGWLIDSNLIANSPFAATPTAWALSIGLIVIGLATSVFDR